MTGVWLSTPCNGFRQRGAPADLRPSCALSTPCNGFSFLTLRAGGGLGVATLSTPCNGFLVRQGAGRRVDPGALSTPCNGFSSRAPPLRQPVDKLSTPCNGFSRFSSCSRICLVARFFQLHVMDSPKLRGGRCGLP